MENESVSKTITKVAKKKLSSISLHYLNLFKNVTKDSNQIERNRRKCRLEDTTFEISRTSIQKEK